MYEPDDKEQLVALAAVSERVVKVVDGVHAVILQHGRTRQAKEGFRAPGGEREKRKKRKRKKKLMLKK